MLSCRRSMTASVCLFFLCTVSVFVTNKLIYYQAEEDAEELNHVRVGDRV